MLTRSGANARPTPTTLTGLGGFVVLGVLAAWAAPVLDHALNPAARKPGLISFLGVGLAVLGLTAILLFYGLRGFLPRTGTFLAAALGYNALLIAVKLGLGPLAIYTQNEVNKVNSLQAGHYGEDPGYRILSYAISYPGLAAITAILYAFAFFSLYLIFQARLERRFGITVGFERRFVQLLVGMFVLATVGGVTVIGLLGFLEYAYNVLFSTTLGILIAAALVGAIALCAIAFDSAAEQAAAVRNVTVLTTFAWIGLAFIAAYHILWLVFLLTLVSLWPLKPWSYVSAPVK